MEKEPRIIRGKKVANENVREDYRGNKEVKKILAAFLNEIVAGIPEAAAPQSSEKKEPIAPHPDFLNEKSDSQRIPANDAEKIFNSIEIHGDPFKGKRLTKEILRKVGLMPTHAITINENEVIWLSSSAYALGHGRIAVMAYVRKDNKTIARSYYRSNSQAGIWRFMPDYTLSASGHINWYGKGWNEEGVTLPSIVQKKLAEISSSDKEPLELADPEFIFAGAARYYGGVDQASYYHEIESAPLSLENTFIDTPTRIQKINPRELKLSRKNSPNFNVLLDTWKQDTPLYGEITIEVFPSNDGTLKFMFCKTADGRAMVGSIENNSPMKSTGLRKTWVFGGDLVTPIFEYESQAAGYGNKNIRSGHYVDMFENYISKIPVIQEYLARNPLELIR